MNRSLDSLQLMYTVIDNCYTDVDYLKQILIAVVYSIYSVVYSFNFYNIIFKENSLRYGGVSVLVVRTLNSRLYNPCFEFRFAHNYYGVSKGRGGDALY